MTDLELLFLVFAVVYCWECLWWTKRGLVGFRTWLGIRWRIVSPAVLLGNQTGGVLFANPLPPLGTLLAGSPWPLSISAEAVLAYIPPSIDPAKRSLQTGSLFLFDEMQRIESVGKQVRVNGKLLLKGGSASFAYEVAQTLHKLKKLATRDRHQAIERIIAEAFDTRAIEERWTRFRETTATLGLLTNLLFGYCFLAVPALIWRLGLTGTWVWLLGGLVSCTLSIAVLFSRSHKRLYPALADERFTQFLIVLLSPASAVRALDSLSRPLLEGFHPLAVAKVFCPREAWRDLAAQYLRELRYPPKPPCPRTEPAAQVTEHYARELAAKTLEKFLRENRIRPGDLLQPPIRSDPACLSYCPRCLTQFTPARGLCQDCGGVDLVSFSAEQNSSGTGI
jgi:hypothetical protein